MIQILYRAWNGPQLLYVGVSKGFLKRIGEHVKGSDWAKDVDRMTFQHFDTREAVLAAEREAIQNERPEWNVQWQKRNCPSAPGRGPVEFSGEPDNIFESEDDAARRIALKAWTMFNREAPHWVGRMADTAVAKLAEPIKLQLEDARLLSAREAAAVIGISAFRLRARVREGTGPDAYPDKVGQPMFLLPDIRRFAEAERARIESGPKWKG